MASKKNKDTPLLEDQWFVQALIDFGEIHDFFSEEAAELEPDINYKEFIYWFLYNAQIVIRYTEADLSYSDFSNELNDAASRTIRNWLHLKTFFAFCLLKHSIHDVEKDAVLKKLQALAQKVNDLMQKVETLIKIHNGLDQEDCEENLPG
jgi:hypothetical protein